MKNFFSQYFSDFSDKIIFETGCLWLRFKNLLRGRKIRVGNVWLDQAVVIENQTARLRWQAEGCHKIIVVNHGALRGDQNGVVIAARNTVEKIKIRFCGAGKTIEKSICLNVVRVVLLNSFENNLNLPLANSVPFAGENLSNHLAELQNALPKREVHLRQVNFNVEISEAKLIFDAFEPQKLNNPLPNSIL